MNSNINHFNKLDLINNKLLTIGQLPTSYLISMTYEEQLLWLSNYLEKTLIPTMNELITAFNNAMYEIQENIGEIASDVIDEKIKNGELIVSLGITYDDTTEALDFHIEGEPSNAILDALEELTTPSGSGE